VTSHGRVGSRILRTSIRIGRYNFPVVLVLFFSGCAGLALIPRISSLSWSYKDWTVSTSFDFRTNSFSATTNTHTTSP